MKRASITEAKNQLSALIDRVRRGDRGVIEDRGVPVARLDSVLDLPEDDEGRVARLEREGSLSAAQATEALGRLDRLRASWIEIEAGDEVREVARRMLRVHPLRAARALQLAAAWLGAERRPTSLPLVTLDERLRAAAAREGFPLVDI